MFSKQLSTLSLGIITAGLLAACAPAMSGSSVRNPVSWEPTEALTLNVEGTTYVAVDLPPALFNYSSEDINASWKPTVTQNSVVGSSQNTNIANSFSLGDIIAPDGWNVELERAYLVREVTDRTVNRTASRNTLWTTTNTYYQQFFRFTLAVTPEGEREGVVLLTFKSPKGQQAVPLLVGAAMNY